MAGALIRLNVAVVFAMLAALACLGPSYPSSDASVTIFVIAFFLLLVCYSAVISAFAARWPLSAPTQQKWRSAFGEFIDVVVALAFGVLCLLLVTETPLREIVIVGDSLWPLAFTCSALVVWVLISATILRQTKCTFGMFVARVNKADRPIASLTLQGLTGRQALFGVWALVNGLFLVPAIVIRVFTKPKDSRLFYDYFGAWISGRGTPGSNLSDSHRFASGQRNEHSKAASL